METGTRRVVAILLTAAVPLSALGGEGNPDQGFKPFKLTGNWKFVNSNTGVNYGGDIEVAIESVDPTGIMHGHISYDGRQTDDQCGTKPLFVDTPVEAEVMKRGNEYRVSYSVKCLKGESPRRRSLTVVCGEDGVCSSPKPFVLAWGTGMTVLKIKR
jgi:hypothetical protein